MCCLLKSDERVLEEVEMELRITDVYSEMEDVVNRRGEEGGDG